MLRIKLATYQICYLPAGIGGNPRWLAIIGPRKIGKTSLLLELERMAISPPVVAVVLDSFEQTPPSLDIFRRYSLRCLDASLLSPAPRRVAHSPATLPAMGFDLVYQSRASRGAFNVLAIRGARQLGVQVKRSQPPLRFKKAEWSRMEAEALRLRWRWVIASVAPSNSEVKILDPAKAHIGKEARLHAAHDVPNLLSWLDEHSSAKDEAESSDDSL